MATEKTGKPKSETPTPTSERELQTLKNNGKWAVAITLMTFMYGDMTVARVLPPDPRQNSWLTMMSPYPNLVLSMVYVAAVTWWGPRYMSTRKPVQGLRPLMMAYNAFQVVFSVWLFWQAGVAGWFGGYKFVCEACDFSDHPKAIQMMHCGYWYMFSKYIDFIDTIFFVMNKKPEHISLLHVSHHALMPVGVWYGIRYQPGGHGTMMGFLNAFVHAVMYLYYLLAAMGPRVRPFLWWKKYLTGLQMAQFTFVFFHALALVFVDCEVPLHPALLRWLMGQAVIFFALFADFYIKAYQRKDKSKMKLKGDNLANGESKVKNGFTCIPSGLEDLVRERKRSHN